MQLLDELSGFSCCYLQLFLKPPQQVCGRDTVSGSISKPAAQRSKSNTSKIACFETVFQRNPQELPEISQGHQILRTSNSASLRASISIKASPAS